MFIFNFEFCKDHLDSNKLTLNLGHYYLEFFNKYLKLIENLIKIILFENRSIYRFVLDENAY